MGLSERVPSAPQTIGNSYITVVALASASSLATGVSRLAGSHPVQPLLFLAERQFVLKF